MLIALALTLLIVLSVLRRILEPACPGCSAKSWSDHPVHLTCTRCGWSSVPTGAPAAAVEAVPGQYEIAFR